MPRNSIILHLADRLTPDAACGHIASTIQVCPNLPSRVTGIVNSLYDLVSRDRESKMCLSHQFFLRCSGFLFACLTDFRYYSVANNHGLILQHPLSVHWNDIHVDKGHSPGRPRFSFGSVPMLGTGSKSEVSLCAFNLQPCSSAII